MSSCKKVCTSSGCRTVCSSGNGGKTSGSLNSSAHCVIKNESMFKQLKSTDQQAFGKIIQNGGASAKDLAAELSKQGISASVTTTNSSKGDGVEDGVVVKGANGEDIAIWDVNNDNVIDKNDFKNFDQSYNNGLSTACDALKSSNCTGGGCKKKCSGGNCGNNSTATNSAGSTCNKGATDSTSNSNSLDSLVAALRQIPPYNDTSKYSDSDLKEIAQQLLKLTGNDANKLMSTLGGSTAGTTGAAGKTGTTAADLVGSGIDTSYPTGTIDTSKAGDYKLMSKEVGPYLAQPVG